MNASTAAAHSDTVKQRGLTEEQLATLPTVYRDGLLEGHVMMVSGAGSGIGKGIAVLAARLGAEVIICGRSEEKLAATASLLEKVGGRAPLSFPLSIRDPEKVEQMFATALERFGHIDSVVNNAGGQFPQDAIEFKRKGWLAVIDTNLNGTWWMMQEAAQLWRARGQAGNIINIVANVERGMPQAAHTCAARAGVIYLSKTVATEWAPHRIRVNCIAPGVIETEGFAVYPEAALHRFHEANPMKKRGSAWDIAEAVVYLSAPSARFITGEMLVIDGGQAQYGVVWPAGMPGYFSGGA